ncbi:MAG TPA: hypothetical protein VEQ59_18890, partial [Polyangiaceae bacterium]|nr:hypothetical protein [Polyangiaceae bacterium]
MKRSFPAAGFISCALGLLLAALLPGACSSDADPLDATTSSGATSASGASSSGETAGGSGRFPFGGRSNVNSGGQASAGDDGSVGGEASAAGAPSAGNPPSTVDRCESDDDCRQVAGSCFVCETAGAAKDCVDKGLPVCDDGVVEPCELCELDQVKDCTELGEPGEFSGGSAYCSATCDGWDTSTCSICGNGKSEPGEDCDGSTPPLTKTCGDIGLAQDPATVLRC